MPHIIVEYSADLDQSANIPVLCRALFDAAAEHETFPNPTAIKLRTVPCTHWITGGTSDPFVHVTLRLLPGRPEGVRAELTHLLLGTLRDVMPALKALSVDIKDLDAAYVKRPS